MIPKTLHYCWVGGAPKPPLVQRCIDSWKRFLPEYEIREWNENNFDVASTLYIRQAYEAKRYAFVSDYIRLFVLHAYGGIYLDTDVELLRPLDRFLGYEAFSGFEDTGDVAAGVVGAVKGQEFIWHCLRYYAERPFLKPDGACDLTTIVMVMTRYLAGKGLVKDCSEQEVAGVHLFPPTYFYPKSLKHRRTYFTPDTCAVHYYMDSWNTPREKIVNKVRITMVDTLGEIIGLDNLHRLKKRLGVGEANEV